MSRENQTTTLPELLERFDNLFGVSGQEDAIGEALFEEMNGFYDEFRKDALGNYIFTRYGRDRTKEVMFCAHMDEIGFVVSYIEENGFVRFAPVGFHDDRMAINQNMVIMTAKGPVQAITGAKPFHILSHEEAERVIKIEDLFADLGTASRNETEALGVRIGDYMGFDRQGFFLNGKKVYTGKSVDNRASCAVLVDVMRRLKDLYIEPTIHIVGTVQEEVGMRGAGPVTFSLEPELVLALDLTIAGGAPDIEERQCPVAIGKGPAIKFYDWDPVYGMVGNNVPKKLTNRLVAVCEKNDIPFQREVLMGGGTDGWSAAMSGKGVLAGVLSIPAQYVHTAVGTVNIDDMEQMSKLIVAFLSDYVSL